jgi:ATP-dependent Clp protease ATP-binding subunit ClpA
VRIVGPGEPPTSGQVPFTPRAKKVLKLALNEALALGHNYIGTEHILLGLVRENEGVAARILLDFDADPGKVRNQVIKMLSAPREPAARRPTTYTTPRSAGMPAIEPAWLGGLSEILDELAAEIRRHHLRTPDTGDLLLVLAAAPDTIAGSALRELATNPKALPDVVERVRENARADDPLAQQLDELIQAREQLVENLARLRAQEQHLQTQADAHKAFGAEAVQEIRRQLGLPLPDDPSPPDTG